MNDLDDALRTMLGTRALEDIPVLPSHLTRFDTGAVVRPPRRDTRTLWLVAASVVAVLAVVAALLAIAEPSHHQQAPPTTHTPSVPPPRVTSSVSLSWFGMAPLPGYALHARESEPGHQWLSVRYNADNQAPIGCNGCESASVYVTVFAEGRFNDAKYGIRAGGRGVMVGKVHARLGVAAEINSPTHVVPTVAWQYQPGAWALVQGVTTFGGKEHTLLTVADAVRPTESVPIGMPCTFGYLPAMTVTDIVDDRSEGYAFTLTMQGPNRQFSLTLWNGTKWLYYQPQRTRDQRTIDGLSGYFDPHQGVGVLYRGGGMAFAVSDASDTQPDNGETQRVMAAIRWAHGDGRAPLIPLAHALP